MPLTATPGSVVATTLTLPQPATDVVRWELRDPDGDVIAEGSQPGTGVLVAISFVLPSGSSPSLDGTPHTLSATDGISASSDALRVLASIEPSYAHNGELAYSKDTPMRDVLLSDVPLSNVTATVSLHDGTVLATGVTATDGGRIGEAYAYLVDFGVLDTRVLTSYGTGVITWTYDLCNGMPSDDSPQYHAFWTITPYTAGYIAAIRKLVDRARVGDANAYLNVRPSDLANALLRGMDVVIEAAPTLTPFALDQIPISLRDYVIKAGAVDFLRSQYLAEGMSAFDMAGEGVQLNVDRSAYLDGLAQQLLGDVTNGLEKAKGLWMQQGMPLGGKLVPGSRPVGVLLLSTGTFNNYPMRPQSLALAGGGYSFLRVASDAVLAATGFGW